MTAQDNGAVKALIQHTVAATGVFHSPYLDPQNTELDDLFQVFSGPQALMVVLETTETAIVACGALAPLQGGSDVTGIGELQKLYVHPQAQGHGLGSTLTKALIQAAPTLGFHTMYLETTHEMTVAQALYQRLGFTYTTEPLGQSGHHQACPVRMILPLSSVAMEPLD